MRRATFDRVSGRLQLAFAWDVSARGLLVLRLRALEHVLQQRKEILCMLKPISPRDAIHWSHDRDAGGKRKNVSDSQQSLRTKKWPVSGTQGGCAADGTSGWVSA